MTHNQHILHAVLDVVTVKQGTERLHNGSWSVICNTDIFLHQNEALWDCGGRDLVAYHICCFSLAFCKAMLSRLTRRLFQGLSNEHLQYNYALFLLNT